MPREDGSLPGTGWESPLPWLSNDPSADLGQLSSPPCGLPGGPSEVTVVPDFVLTYMSV